MEGLPSQAARRVKGLICKRNFDCCCPAVVGKIWRDKLPEAVRLAVANHDLKTQWDGALDWADNVYYYRAKPEPEVDAVSLDEAAPDELELQQDVADVSVDVDDHQSWDDYNTPNPK